MAGRALALLCVLQLVLLPATARAHQVLEGAVPAADSLLRGAPSELRLIFRERVELPFTHIELIAPDGSEVALGPLAHDADSLTVITATIQSALGAGRYTVRWRSAGPDGHPVNGTYAFTILPTALGLDSAPPVGTGSGATGTLSRGQAPMGGGGGPAAAPSPAVPQPDAAFGAGSPAYVIIRWLTFVGIILVEGIAVFELLVLRAARRREGTRLEAVADASSARAVQLGWLAVLLLGAAAVARLYAQVVAVYGGPAALGTSRLAPILMETVWGWGWILQLAAIVAAGIGLSLARRTIAIGWEVTALAAVALAFVPGLSGHAAAVERMQPAVVIADAVHVMSAGGWLGTLALVVMVGIPAALHLGEGERGAAVAALVNAFSPIALIFAGMAAATGLFAAWVHLGAIPALWNTRYGITLIVKLTLVACVAAVGAYNWRRMRPRLGDVGGARRIHRSAAAELWIGALVVLVTAVLVATPPPSAEPAAMIPSASSASGSP